MTARLTLLVLLLGTGLLAASPTNYRLLLVILTPVAIYFGYRLQLGSNET